MPSVSVYNEYKTNFLVHQYEYVLVIIFHFLSFEPPSRVAFQGRVSQLALESRRFSLHNCDVRQTFGKGVCNGKDGPC